MEKIRINKQQIITTIFILFCLAGYIYFPAKGAFQYKAALFVFLVVLPFIYNDYFLKRASVIRQIIIGDWKKNIQYLAIGLVVALFVMFCIFKYSNIWTYYYLPNKVKVDFLSFLLYEFGGIAFMVAIYEIFFRGFVMNFFLNSLKEWAIVVQFLFFGAMIIMLWKLPFGFYAVYFVFTPIAGWIFYKTRSILYSFIAQWMFIVITDAVFIAMIVNK